MTDLAGFSHCCPFCEEGAMSAASFALHLEGHFLDGAERWFGAVLPRVVDRPPARVAVSA